MPPRAWLALLVALLGARATLAVQLDELETGGEWRLRALVFRGNHALGTGELRRAMATADRDRLLAALPLVRGQVFAQDAYDRGVTYLRAFYREHGFARVRVRKRAEVDVRHDRARVAYRLESGPPCVFGEVRVSGTRGVD